MRAPNADQRLYRHACREALIVLLVTGAALLWSVGYCYVRGYQHPPESWLVKSGLAPSAGEEPLQLVLGMPHWVVIGILAPWLSCSVFTVIFCLFFMKDDDLGAEAPEEAGHDR